MEALITNLVQKRLGWKTGVFVVILAWMMTACAAQAALQEQTPAAGQSGSPEALQSTPIPTLPEFQATENPTPPPVEDQPMADTPVPTSNLLPQVEAAVADLASRLGIAPSSIEVVKAEAVVWGDSSLGCPQPGMEYAQALVEGMLIQLQASGQTYYYHSGGSGQPFLCEQGMKP